VIAKKGVIAGYSLGFGFTEMQCQQLNRAVALKHICKTSIIQKRYASRWTKPQQIGPENEHWKKYWLPYWEPPVWRKHQLERKLEALKPEHLRKKPPQLPTFQELYRSFLMKVHPDRLENWSKHKQINSDNISALNDFLDIIRLKSKTDPKSPMYPENLIYKFVFYLVPESENEEPRLVRFNLRCAGGRCPHLVRHHFQKFFREVGIPSYEFQWGPGMWPTHCEIDTKYREMLEQAKREKEKQKKK